MKPCERMYCAAAALGPQAKYGEITSLAVSVEQLRISDLSEEQRSRIGGFVLEGNQLITAWAERLILNEQQAFEREQTAASQLSGAYRATFTNCPYVMPWEEN